MKTEITQLIDRLASKELTFGCRGIALKDCYDNEEDDIEKPSNRIHWQEEDDLICLGDEYDGAFQVMFCPRTKARIFIGASNVDKWFKPIGHPILIGDVLEKMYAMQEARKDEAFPNAKISIGEKCAIIVTNENERQELLKLWDRCGFTKSLQSIFEEAEWECICSMESVGHSPTCQMTPYGKVWPKQPHIKNLFQFLLQLGL